MSETTTTTKRKRTAKARHRDVVVGCIAERLTMLRIGPFPTRPIQEGLAADAVLFCEAIANRLEELVDELRRSLVQDANGGSE